MREDLSYGKARMALADISGIYEKPITDSSRIEVFTSGDPDIRLIDNIREYVDSLSSGKRLLGMESTDGDAGGLEGIVSAIKSDPAWKAMAEILMLKNSISKSKEGLVERIAEPRWIDKHEFFNADIYNKDNNELKVFSIACDSYLAQANDFGANPLAMSTMNILTTSDGRIVLGQRSEKVSRPGTYDTVGIGSVSDLAEGEPLFSTVRENTQREFGITEDDGSLYDLKLIGRVEDKALLPFSFYVFTSKTDKDVKGLFESHKGSERSGKYSKLFSVSKNYSDIMDFIEHRLFDDKKGNPYSFMETSKENKGSILPSGAAGLLLYGAFENGRNLAKYALERFEKRFTFSCYNMAR